MFSHHRELIWFYQLAIALQKQRGKYLEDAAPAYDYGIEFEPDGKVRISIRERGSPTAPVSGSAKELGYDLPRSLGEALDGLEGCPELREMLGERFCRAYVSVKRKEYETFFRVISSWEREFLLLNV